MTTTASPHRTRVGDRAARTAFAVSAVALLGMVHYDTALLLPIRGGAEVNPGVILVNTGVLLFFCALLMVRMVHTAEPPGRYPRDSRAPILLRIALVALAVCAANIPLALWLTGLRDAWSLIVLLLYPVGLTVWALVRLLMGLRDAEREPAPVPPEAPKLVGVRDPSRMPPGWVPAVFHGTREGHVAHTALEVDGEHVGFLRPGGSPSWSACRRAGTPPASSSTVPRCAPFRS